MRRRRCASSAAYDALLDLLGEYRGEPAAGVRALGRDLAEVVERAAADRRHAALDSRAERHRAGAPRRRSSRYWENWGVPALAGYDGMVWFRARVKLDSGAGEAGGEAVARVWSTTSMSPGSTAARWAAASVMTQRVYDAAAETAQGRRQPRRRQCARHVGQWRHARARRASARWCCADGTAVPLDGWEYQVAPPGLGLAAARALGTRTGVSVLYNGMIAPLGKFRPARRGLVPGRGECRARRCANVTRRSSRRCITDWRRQFDAPLPFLVVQLANWNALVDAPVDSGWAQLRDAQRRAVAADGNAGLAVTIDIGNRDDIHPDQQAGRGQAAGARRAPRGVRREDFGVGRAADVAARRATRRVEVTLGDFDGELRRDRRADPAGFELCGDDAGQLSLRARAAAATAAWCCSTDAGRARRPRACASAGPTRRCAICSTARDCPWGRSRSREPVVERASARQVIGASLSPVSQRDGAALLDRLVDRHQVLHVRERPSRPTPWSASC